MELTQQEFFRLKIFCKKSISLLRRDFGNQNDKITNWYKCSEYKAMQKMLTYLKNKKDDREENFPEEITFELVNNILKWKTVQEPVCHYCGLPEGSLLELQNQPRHLNKRWPKRGKTLEVDRVQANLPYSNLRNLVLACYWCNNAKTDTFSYKEFKEVAVVFNQIWNNRLGTKFKIPQLKP